MADFGFWGKANEMGKKGEDYHHAWNSDLTTGPLFSHLSTEVQAGTEKLINVLVLIILLGLRTCSNFTFFYFT